MTNLSPQQKSNLLRNLIIVAVCAVLLIVAMVISRVESPAPIDVPTIDPHGDTHYNDMKYLRPDVDSFVADVEELCEMIKSEQTFSQQRDIFEKIDSDLGNFYTMFSLAEIRYFSNTADEFYEAEYNYLNEVSLTVYDKSSELMDTIAASSFKVAYERNYFGNDYFTDWQPLDYPDDLLALMKKDAELKNRYLDEISDPKVTVNNQEIRLAEVDFANISPLEYEELMRTYNEKFAEIYVQLVKTRLQIAEKLGVDYEDYAYAELDREFTPEDAEAYIKNVSKDILPLYYVLDYAPETEGAYVDSLTVFTSLKNGATNMGGVIGSAFEYMFEYGLYDMSYSETKAPMSFQTYITNYNSPFVFVSPHGDHKDLMTCSHEFGHFVDAYYNLNAGITIDNTEIASQSMELLLPLYADDPLTGGEYDYLKSGLRDLLETYLHAGFTALFESRVYKLSPDEITVDNLNKLAYECAIEIGIDEELATYLSRFWMETQHIYIAPAYSISYIVSGDVALQVLEAEIKSPGKGGVDAYMNIIDRDSSLAFMEDLDVSGFVSPFEEGRTAAAAKFISDAFEGKNLKVENDEQK